MEINCKMHQREDTVGWNEKKSCETERDAFSVEGRGQKRTY